MKFSQTAIANIQRLRKYHRCFLVCLAFFPLLHSSWATGDRQNWNSTPKPWITSLFFSFQDYSQNATTVASQHLQMALRPADVCIYPEAKGVSSGAIHCSIHTHLPAFIPTHSELQPSNFSCNLLGVQPWYKQMTNYSKTFVVNKAVKGSEPEEPKYWTWVLHSEYIPPTWYCWIFQSLSGLDHLPSLICDVHFNLLLLVNICN